MGKTTLLKHFYDSIDNGIFLTFEDIKSFIALYVDPYDYIFIDEFQYANMDEKHLKFIYDSTDKKIFISRSSAMELSINTVKYLSGHIFVFNMYSFSFGEFLRTKDENLIQLYKKSDHTISNTLSNKIYGYFDEYMLYGGYPRVVLNKSIEEKKDVG